MNKRLICLFLAVFMMLSLFVGYAANEDTSTDKATDQVSSSEQDESNAAMAKIVAKTKKAISFSRKLSNSAIWEVSGNHILRMVILSLMN